MKTLLSLLVVAMLAIAAPIKTKGSDDGRTELEGKWVVTKATTLGVEQEKMVGFSFVVKGDKFTVNSTPASKSRIKVNDKKSPKHVEFEVLGADGKPSDGKNGGWIYELDGDELQMASFTDSDGSVPEKIDPTDRKQLVWKAKRVKE
jgi:uncharacterized protein (TIGR03067 family)